MSRLLADRAALAAMAVPRFPFGDGQSAPRIAALALAWLDAQADDAAARAFGVNRAQAELTARAPASIGRRAPRAAKRWPLRLRVRTRPFHG